MNRMRKGAVLVVAALVTVLLTASAAVRAQVLQQVPSDALVVLKVNNLKSASDKFAKLAQDLGLAAMAPDMADPLAALQAKTKMQNGLDTAGEMAFVFMDPATVGGDSDQAMLILVPVSDYKAFLGNWPDAKTEGEVSEVTMGEGEGKPGFVAQWGKYAVLSPNKDAVGKKPAAGISVPAVTSKEMSGKDAVLYANFTALRAKLLPELQKGRATVLEQVQKGIENEPQAARFSPVIKALVNQAMNVAEGFLKDAQAATVGLVIVPEGINTTVMAEFAPDSYAGKLVSASKNTDAPLLAGIPQGKYLVFGGGVNDPQMATKIIDDFSQPVLKELAAMGPEMKAVQDYVDALKAYVSAQKGQTFGVLAPSGAVGAEPLLQFVSVQSGDAKAMAESFAKMTQAQQEMMKAFNVPGVQAVQPTLTKAAKTVDGVTFDSIVTKVDMNAQDPAAMQQAQVMTMVYGPNGAVVNYGVVGDKLLTLSGVGDDFTSEAIKAVKGNEAPLAAVDRVKTVASQLPTQRLAVVYVPVDDIVATGLSYAKQFGFAMNVQLPPDLPPIGLTAGTEATAVRFDSHVPTTLVQSLVAAGMQAAMQMQGGGPQGGGL